MMEEMIGYVTYETDGNLDGCYIQVPPAEHVGRMIVVSDEIRWDWTSYKANDDRDGVVLLPPWVPPVDQDQPNP